METNVLDSMTREEKQLLLADLCSRLPYNFVYCYCNAPLANGKSIILTPVVISNLMNADKDLVIKPYLHLMSSMTEEEKKKELSIIILDCEFYVNDDFALRPEDDRHGISLELCEGYIDWLNEHHFDYRGLIPMGLALKAPEGMYK